MNESVLCLLLASLIHPGSQQLRYGSSALAPFRHLSKSRSTDVPRTVVSGSQAFPLVIQQYGDSGFQQVTDTAQPGYSEIPTVPGESESRNSGFPPIPRTTQHGYSGFRAIPGTSVSKIVPNDLSCKWDPDMLIIQLTDIPTIAECASLCTEDIGCRVYNSFAEVTLGSMRQHCHLLRGCHEINYSCPGCHLGERKGSVCRLPGTSGGRLYCRRRGQTGTTPPYSGIAEIENLSKCVYLCGTTPEARVMGVECRFGDLYRWHQVERVDRLNCPCSAATWLSSSTVCSQGLVPGDEGEEVKGGTECSSTCPFSTHLKGPCETKTAYCVDGNWTVDLQSPCSSTPIWLTSVVISIIVLLFSTVGLIFLLILYYRAT